MSDYSKEVLRYIESFSGNYVSNPVIHFGDGNKLTVYSNIYISFANMKHIFEITSIKAIPISIYLTPFVISEAFYELMYYSTYCELTLDQTHLREFCPTNCLPGEILENIHPGIMLNVNDYTGFATYLADYLDAMDRMRFEDDSTALGLLAGGGGLYYEVFVGTDPDEISWGPFVRVNARR